MSDEENVRLIMHVYNVSDIEARFILGVEKGELPGDAVIMPGDTVSPSHTPMAPTR